MLVSFFLVTFLLNFFLIFFRHQEQRITFGQYVKYGYAKPFGCIYRVVPDMRYLTG